MYNISSNLNNEAEALLVGFTNEQMLNYNLHLGHKCNNYNNHLLNFYIDHIRNNMGIINLNYTSIRLRTALNFISSVIKNRGYIVFFNNAVGYQVSLNNLAISLKRYFVNGIYRPGVFTNFKFVKIHYDCFKGIYRLPSGIFVPQHSNAIYLGYESNALKIPSIGLMDSTYVRGFYNYEIPGNDKSFDSVKFLSYLFANSVRMGLIRRRLRFKNILLQSSKNFKYAL